jgi:hypothetical protein
MYALPSSFNTVLTLPGYRHLALHDQHDLPVLASKLHCASQVFIHVERIVHDEEVDPPVMRGSKTSINPSGDDELPEEGEEEELLEQ